MCDWEYGISLHIMQGNQASSRGKGEVSWLFLSWGRKLVYILEFLHGCQLKTCFYSSTSGHLSSYKGQLRNLDEAWQGNTDTSRGEAGEQVSLSSCHSDIGFPVYFQEDSGIVTFCSIELMCLSKYRRDVRPPIQMRWGHRAFSRVSTGDSDIPSSCEMKDEPAFKPLQGNPAFFQVRASRFPFHLRQQTQGPSHITIAEGSLLPRCLWKVGSSLQSDSGNQLSSGDAMGYTEFTQVAVLKLLFL